MNGGIHVSETVAAALVNGVVGHSGKQNNSAFAALSDRELEVFELLGRGYEVGRIALELSITRKCVYVYVDRLRQKLDARGFSELRRKAFLYDLQGTQTASARLDFHPA